MVNVVGEIFPGSMKMASKKGFGARVREFREAAGLTQQEAAERAGMLYQALARIERGDRENPTLDTIRAIAIALGVKPEQLIE